MSRLLRFVLMAFYVAGGQLPLTTFAHAQSYPTKAVRLVVPFPPGASNDVIARLIGQKLAENLRQPMVIDNRGGAGGALGAEIVAKAPADGYTLLATSTTYTTNAA